MAGLLCERREPSWRGPVCVGQLVMAAISSKFTNSVDAPWANLISDDQWAVYLVGTAAAQRAQVPFLVGGAMALATYTGRWRNTKDLDFIVQPEHRDQMIRALREDGFTDYFDQETYDRSWIFRGFRDGVILDIIWTLPNHRVDVDVDWFHYSRPVRLRDQLAHAVAVEDLIHVKLYVMQRERCDWVDVLNALAGHVEGIDWDHLLTRMGRDVGLLQGVLAVFAWLCPGRARKIPASVRERFALNLPETEEPAEMEVRRVKSLDSRSWFAPLEPVDRVLER
jgi:hypothetical protein